MIKNCKKIETRTFKYPFVLMFFLLLFSTTRAQDLVVTFIDNTTEVFPVSDIKSLKFVSGNMILEQNDDTIFSWTIPSIDNYSFGTLSINDDFAIEKNNLTIYPNPAGEIVNIQYKSHLHSKITIDILDLNGRVISTIYNGNHHGKQTYQWIANQSHGVYYCRITTEKNTITKPIIIK